MIDFLTLVTRDHHDLDTAIGELLEAATVAQLRASLDAVRLGLMAHAEAEDIVLQQVTCDEAVRELLDNLVHQVRAAHLAQEGALAALICATPGTSRWRDCAFELRELVRDHASYEELHVIPAIRELVPDAYRALAGSFATERLRQLAMLQPSAPIYMVPAVAHAS